MAEARRERSSAGGPAGWMVLLGLMVLALIIAAASKGCGDSDNTTPASQSPSGTTGQTSTKASSDVDVIDQINLAITSAGGIQFATGKTDLTAESKTTLDSVAALLASNPTVKAEVRGYTDNQGDPKKNQELSKKRADAVVTYLIGKGVQNGRLTARGLGDANPIGDNNTEAGRAQNRRITFAIAP